MDAGLTKAAPNALDAERRAIAIRDHIVPLVQSRGQGHQYGRAGVSGLLHLTTWKCAPFRCVLRVPFRPPGVPGEAASQRAEPVPHQRSSPALLPYGLDVWRRQKVLSLAWDPDGLVEIVAFRRGAWEVEALAL
jgi:hypothetical protein